MYIEQKLSLAECWNLPTPTNYFEGLQLNNFPFSDNFVFFRRTDRTTLCERTFESRPHHRYVLVVNCGANGSVSVDADTYKLHPGQVFLIAPFQFRFYWDVETEDISWVFMTFESERREALTPLVNLPIDMDEKCWRILDYIAGDYHRILTTQRDTYYSPIETNMWILQCNRFLQRLLVQARSIELPEKQSIYTKDDGRLIVAVNKYLESRSFEEQSISDLADELHISTSHLRRKFLQITGFSIGSYMLHYRMNQAIKMIVHSDANLTEISDHCGYESLAAFSRSFKSKFGVSPSEYRKQMVSAL